MKKTLLVGLMGLALAGCSEHDEFDPEITLDTVATLEHSDLCSVMYFTNKLKIYKAQYTTGATAYGDFVRNAVISQIDRDILIKNGQRETIGITNDTTDINLTYGSTATVNVAYPIGTFLSDIPGSHYKANLAFYVDGARNAENSGPRSDDNYIFFENDPTDQNGTGTCGRVYFYSINDQIGQRSQKSGINAKAKTQNSFDSKLSVSSISIESMLKKEFNTSTSEGRIEKSRAIIEATKRVSQFMSNQMNDVIKNLINSPEAIAAKGVSKVSESAAQKIIKNKASKLIKEKAQNDLYDLKTDQFVKTIVEQL